MASASVVLARCCESLGPAIGTRASATNGRRCEFDFVTWRGVGFAMDIGGYALCFDVKAGR